MKNSTVKHSNESFSCSLVAVPGRKIRQSAASTEIEYVAMDFTFNFIFIKFAYCCYTFFYVEICLCRKTGLIFIRHSFSVLNDTKKRSPLSPELFAIRQSLEAPIF